jgi:hypothetical protein
MFYCKLNSQSPPTFTTSWQLYSFSCTPNTSGSANIAITAQTPIGGTTGSTGTFYFAGLTVSPVQPVTTGQMLAAVDPYGVGAAPAVIDSAAGTPLTTCNAAAMVGNSRFRMLPRRPGTVLTAQAVGQSRVTCCASTTARVTHGFTNDGPRMQTIILRELCELRSSFDAFARSTDQRLSALEAQTLPLLVVASSGNGRGTEASLNRYLLGY